jgi:hypothetical protein
MRSVGDDVFNTRIQVAAAGTVPYETARKIERDYGLTSGTLNSMSVVVYTGQDFCVRGWRESTVNSESASSKKKKKKKKKKHVCSTSCGRILRLHCDNVNAPGSTSNSQRADTTIFTVNGGCSRTIDTRFTSNGKKEGLRSDCQSSEFKTECNSLTMLPGMFIVHSFYIFFIFILFFFFLKKWPFLYSPIYYNYIFLFIF